MPKEHAFEIEAKRRASQFMLDHAWNILHIKPEEAAAFTKELADEFAGILGGKAIGGAGDLAPIPDWVRRQMGVHVVAGDLVTIGGRSLHLTKAGLERLARQLGPVVNATVLKDLLDLVQPVVELHQHCVTIREELKEILGKVDVDAGQKDLDDLVLGIAAVRRVLG